jgi:hypothetical protein
LRRTLVSFLLALVVGVTAYVAISQIPKQPANASALVQANQTEAPKHFQPDSPNFRDSPPRQLRPEELEEASQKRISDRTASRAIAIKLRVTARQGREHLIALTEEMVAWKATYLPLLTNDMGRRIAGHEDRMNLALSALQGGRPTDDDLQNWREQLNELITPLDEVLDEKDNPAIVPPSHASLIQEIARDVSKAFESVRHDRLVLDTIMKEVATLEPGPLTLLEAQNAMRLAEAAAKSKQLEEARRAALAEDTKQVAAAEKEQMEEATRVKVQEIKTKTAELAGKNLKLKDAQAAAELLHAKELADERLRNEYRAAQGQINSLLRYFTDHGYTHRGKNPGKGPVSLTALRSGNCLEQTAMGRARLCEIVITNDRKGGGLPMAVNQSPSQNDLYNRAQELLLKFGQLMIDDKLLAE